MRKLEGIISKSRECDLVKDRNRAMNIQKLKFYCLTLLWVIVLTGVMYWCTILNTYMVIPRIGHSVFVDVLLYILVAFTAYATVSNIRRYYYILQYNLDALRLKYNQPIIKSYAKKLAYYMAYGLIFVNLEDVGKYY